VFSSIHSMNTVGYCSSIEGLVQLAPPTNHPVPFAFSAAQTILVTHYVDCSTEQPAITESGSFDDDHQSLPRPWPTQPQASFISSDSAQKPLLCLEIASGSAANHMPELMEQGGSQVLLPGSLREFGEFSIVELALSPSKHAASANSKTSKQRTFAWKVQKVDFHRLGCVRGRM
jgi:hypothetical protein